jgi:signal transduction histidine kinase
MWSKLAVRESDCCSDGIVLLDERWRCIAMNTVAADLLDTDAIAAADKPVWDVLEQVVDVSTCEQWRRTCVEQLPADLGAFRASHGRYVACRCWPAGTSVLLSMIDVTEFREPLKAAVDERRRVESFLAEVAHELRTPLATLSQGLAVLRTQEAAVDREALIERMERQLRYFIRVVDDLLDVARIVRGRIEVRSERVDVGSVVGQAVDAVAPLAAGKGVSVHTELPSGAAVRGDAVRLEQVLINLLKNAVDATDAGGQVRVSAGRKGTEMEIAVRDKGRGIAAEQLSQLFLPSYEYRDGAGLGVGLGVVKRLVELQGGQVTACSDGAGRGATFTVRLPSGDG